MPYTVQHMVLQVVVRSREELEAQRQWIIMKEPQKILMVISRQSIYMQVCVHNSAILNIVNVLISVFLEEMDNPVQSSRDSYEELQSVQDSPSVYQGLEIPPPPKPNQVCGLHMHCNNYTET